MNNREFKLTYPGISYEIQYIKKKDKADYKTKPIPHDVFSKYYTDYLKYIFAYKQLK
jgi:hypothetical protein